ncbi:helicase-associated domain-containing protein [Corynebacterium alimapuense]|uniref:DNA-binding protein n=1 Tax=Corynebacterium alimapuense TaxID=1576874 RepID=A0A3M8K6A7_9CORY|nr:helicase-associated domain-containing protein [Corynebacterium alimapuense]RNE48650.1 DNA-binding protein [Corynebacterium alimapuense]
MTSTPDLPDFRTWLAERSDAELSDLVRSRPDVALPLPPGITPLAARLQLRASVARALRGLTALELATIESAADLGAELHPVDTDLLINDVLARAGSPELTAAQVEAALVQLRKLALIYGEDSALGLMMEASPALPRDWQLLNSADTAAIGPSVAQQIVALEPRQLAILKTLLDSGGFGRTKHAATDADPAHPIARLLAAGLLLKIDEHTVRLPRQVSSALRGEEMLQPPLVPSARATGETIPDLRALDRADQIGAGAGLEVARKLRQLIDILGNDPVELLKEGGVGVRPTTALARRINVDEGEISRLISLGISSGLLNRVDGLLAPTQQADGWLAEELPSQWLTLMQGWISSHWAWWRVGQQDQRKQSIRLLSETSRQEGLVDQRHLILTELVCVAPGVELTDDQLRADFAFAHPLAAIALKDSTFSKILDEARWIGALSAGIATSLLRALLDPAADPQAVAEDITPGTVERVIAQGDMTILAPGPLPRELQFELDLFGELESPGLASLYRVSEFSLRRALDAGRTAQEISGWLNDHCLGQVPQSLLFLIDDVARRHGTLRGGPALSYLRCEDPSLLAEAARTSAAERLALQVIAPTVAVAQAPLVQVIEALRAAGFQPVAEDATGAALDIRPKPLRLPDPAPTATATRVLDEQRVHAAVAAIRRGDQPHQPGHRPPIEHSQTLALLQAAARNRQTVTLGFVDKQGQATHLRVTPLTVNGGQVDAIEQATGQVKRFMLHRITEIQVG